jgi:hypothetical protein
MPRFNISQPSEEKQQISEFEETNCDLSSRVYDESADVVGGNNAQSSQISSRDGKRRRRAEVVQVVKFHVKNSCEIYKDCEIWISTVCDGLFQLTVVCVGKKVPVFPKRLAKFISGEVSVDHIHIEGERVLCYCENVMNHLADLLIGYKLCSQIKRDSDNAILQFNELHFAYFFPDGDLGTPFMNFSIPEISLICCPVCYFVGKPLEKDSNLFCSFCFQAFSDIKKVTDRCSNHQLAFQSQRTYYHSLINMHVHLGEDIRELIVSFIENPFEIGQIVTMRKNNLEISHDSFSITLLENSCKDEVFGIIERLQDYKVGVCKFLTLSEMREIQVIEPDVIEIDLEELQKSKYIITNCNHKMLQYLRNHPSQSHFLSRLINTWKFPRSSSSIICAITQHSLARIHMLLSRPNSK